MVQLRLSLEELARALPRPPTIAARAPEFATLCEVRSRQKFRSAHAAAAALRPRARDAELHSLTMAPGAPTQASVHRGD